MEIRKLKKIEIFVDTIYVGLIVEILENYKIENYAIVRNVVGKIRNELKYEGEVSTNSYIIVLCNGDIVDSILREFLKFQNKFGGVFIISDIEALI